ncbi:PI-PLC X domain-containing protein 3-like [Ornithodoros turicata]|uniref:PI-PLC X domain-containing protein 3-like n=1 Tax=Ornithodoros turicata TaxID=34597 RepID=UPI00313A2994
MSFALCSVGLGRQLSAKAKVCTVAHMASQSDDSITVDLENWMSKLPQELHSVPINNLSIPGSHNSCSYSLSPQSPVAPDETFCTRLVKTLGPIGKHILYNWCLTQSETAKQQLCAGIRYFDLRIATKSDPKDQNLYIVHGLYGYAIDNFFLEVKAFLDEHPREVLLLHFQHFYNMSDDDHQRLLHKLTSTFGALMCQFTEKLENLTLTSLWRKGSQVLSFYNHDRLAKYYPFLWPASYIPNPWPNTDNVSALVTFWDNQIAKGRDTNRFSVLQGVGTPQDTTVAFHICSSLRSLIVPKVNRALDSWVVGKAPGGEHGVNVVMCDFMEMGDYHMPKLVVHLNAKLLENLV